MASAKTNSLTKEFTSSFCRKILHVLGVEMEDVLSDHRKPQRWLSITGQSLDIDFESGFLGWPAPCYTHVLWQICLIFWQVNAFQYPRSRSSTSSAKAVRISEVLQTDCAHHFQLMVSSTARETVRLPVWSRSSKYDYQQKSARMAYPLLLYAKFQYYAR